MDHWLANYCNAEDTELNGEFGSKLLVACVRRIKQPGVKFHTMLVLKGSQGAGKSQMAALLAVRSEWFYGSFNLESDDKTKAEVLARAWIVECQELDGLNKTTSPNLKKFLSTPTDTYRRAYGRDSNEYRRYCIILVTTNEVAYLRDLTENRRVWPVEVAEIDLDGFAANVNQLWVEAVVREKAGGSIVLSEHLWDAAKKLQAGRMVEDDFATVLTDFLEGRVGKVSMDSLKLLLGLQSTRRSHNDFRRIKTAMGYIDWEYGTFRLHDANGKEKRPRKGFAPGNEAQRKPQDIAFH